MKICKLFQRATALALAAVTALSAVPATTAFAAGDIGTISFTHTYDGAGNAIRYNSSANIGGHTAGGTGEYKYRMYVDGETAFCYMGHGTEADSNQVYPRLQETLKEAGYTDYFIGTVEAEPSLEDVTASLKEAGGYKRVVLRPLMVVAGDHANNDLAGPEEDSWASRIKAAGMTPMPNLKGLGQLKGIQDIFLSHTQNAVVDLANTKKAD